MDKRLKYAFDLCSVSTLSVFSNIRSISRSVFDLEREVLDGVATVEVGCFTLVDLLPGIDAVDMVVVGTVDGSEESCASELFNSEA